MSKLHSSIIGLYILAAFLTLVIFISDILTPLGIAWGFVYIIVILLTLWIPDKRSTIVFGCLGFLLTVTGIFLSSTGLEIHIWLTNRVLSIIGIFVTMLGILKYKEKEKIIRLQKKELEKLTEELKISNIDLEQFAYVASHDLQEPLRKIQSFGERILISEKEKLSESGKDYLSRMMNAASRMQILINDLLMYSRFSTRNETFVRLDLNEVVKEVLNDLEVALEKNKVKIDLNCLPVLYADRTQMRQLLQNLISNAIKFKREGVVPEIKIYSTRWNSALNPKQEFAEIIIEDNGIGLEEKYSDKIFQFFQRLEGKKYEGTGIGLAICRKIVMRHGGTITVKSKPGEGSKFQITLPISSVA